MKPGAPLLLAAALASGCASYDRGPLAAASTEELPLRVSVLEEHAEGRACGEWLRPRFRLAVEDALRRHPDANALLDVTLHLEGVCLVVRGRAVRIAPPASGQRAPDAEPPLPATRAPAPA